MEGAVRATSLHPPQEIQMICRQKNTMLAPCHTFARALPWAVLLCSIGSFGQTITATVPTPGFPSQIALNPVTNKIYAINGNNVTVIDGATNSAITVPVG